MTNKNSTVTLIRVDDTATGEIIGYITPAEFRSWFGASTPFIADLVLAYNEAKHGQTVTQVLSAEKD